MPSGGSNVCEKNDETKPEDLGRPGHIFPLRYVDGGVLKRTGQTEASIDLCRLGGLREAAVICEIMADDGHMARMPQLEEFAEQHDIKKPSSWLHVLCYFPEKKRIDCSAHHLHEHLEIFL